MLERSNVANMNALNKLNIIPPKYELLLVQ